jgi:ankyrin repeat protein
LQIRAVLQATTIRDRYEALKTLPSNLDEAFDGTMSRIEQQPSALFTKAARILAWIHLAERPLTVDELLCSLSIKDGDRSLDPNGIPIRKSLLNCCQGLALIDQETSTVRLVHYSLEEYLSRQGEIFGHTKAAWHSKIARTCLTFLQFPSRKAEATIRESGKTITLLFYAATQWGHHLRRADDLGDAPLELAIEYLYSSLANNPEHLRLLYQAMYPYNYQKNILNGVSYTHIAAFFGSSRIMSHLISTSQKDLDSKDGRNKTPLSRAAKNGHEAVVKLLLDTGKVDADSKDDERQTPLSLAAENGHEAVVKLLLDTGKVDADSKDEDLQTPLSLAAENGHEAVVKLLLNTGKVDADSKDDERQTPLSWAAENGHEAVVKLLLNTGKVDADLKDIYRQTPLSLAAENGHEAVVKLLLNTSKVDADSKDIYRQTPLSLAARNGHEAVVKLLQSFIVT